MPLAFCVAALNCGSLGQPAKLIFVQLGSPSLLPRPQGTDSGSKALAEGGCMQKSVAWHRVRILRQPGYPLQFQSDAASIKNRRQLHPSTSVHHAGQSQPPFSCALPCAGQSLKALRSNLCQGHTASKSPNGPQHPRSEKCWHLFRVEVSDC